MGKISKPEIITTSHQVEAFYSGEKTLDEWLQQRALKNTLSGASKTFVVHQSHHVLGYYALAAGSVLAEKVPGKIKRNMPNPIPVMVLGRLAIHQDCQGQGLGQALLKDATLRVVKVSKDVGIRALLVHALSESAKYFYKHHGFIESPLEPMTLMLSIKDIEQTLL